MTGRAAQPLSARGVSGEAALPDLVRNHGYQVPNFTLYGEQHHRNPLKDKSVFAATAPHAEWSKTRDCQTRTQLFEKRRREKQPDITCDLDGDGVVGPKDYFVSKHFSKERDEHLNPAERRAAQAASKNPEWLGKFSFGHDQAGARRPYPVVQKRGKIITVNNVGDLKDVYPPHWNADKVPAHATATHLHSHRRAEVQNLENSRVEEHFKQNPFMVPEPQFRPEGYVEAPLHTSIKDIKHMYSVEARKAAGLLAETTVPNPDREVFELSLAYKPTPHAATRSELEAQRQADMLEGLEATHQQVLHNTIPSRVRHCIPQAADYEKRRPNADAMTLSKLKYQRKMDRIEHNLATCAWAQPELPRFSTQTEPWWALQDGYVHEPQVSKVRGDADDVTGKVHDAPRGKPAATMEEPLPRPPLPKNGMPLSYDSVNGKAKQRWTSEFTPPGLKAMEPRHFDGIKHAHMLASDTEPLHKFSSFATIREEGARKQAEQHQLVSRQDEKRAHSLKFNSAFKENKEVRIAEGEEPPRSQNTSTSLPGENGKASRAPPSHAHTAAVLQQEVSQASLGAMHDGHPLPRTPRAPELSVVQESRLVEPRGANAAMVERLAGMSQTARMARSTAYTSSHQLGEGSIEEKPIGFTVRTGGFQWMDKGTVEGLALPAGKMPASQDPAKHADMMDANQAGCS